jgi:2-oxoisovalerate dehydrogenase E1 component subunit alpha
MMRGTTTVTKESEKRVRKQKKGAAVPPQQSHSSVHFDIHDHRILDADGCLVGRLPECAKQPDQLIALYRIMVKTRLFDEKAIALQRRGQLGTYASSLGQEAIGAAIGTVMADDDVLFPAYREYAAQFLRGVTMADILLYWGGNEQGMNFKGQRHDFPICVPIAGQAPHAVGTAYAMKLCDEKRVAVCVIGDGGTSKGDFCEAINAAGTWALPIVFIVNNNGWAISMPRKRQTGAETLAQKAIAAGFPGEQVDGNDVIALTDRIDQALHKARMGIGPTLIEALTYRLCDHTTADDASRYRSGQEVKEQWHYEPIKRLRTYLNEIDCWSESDEQELLASCHDEVEQAVSCYLNTPPQPPESMFDYLYQSLPAALEEQRASVVQWSKGNE